MRWVDMRHVVYSGELPVNTSGLVVEIEVLIDSDWAPVRDVDVTRGFREVWKWIRVREEKLNLAEGKWFDVLERTICHLSVILRRRRLRRVMNIRLLHLQVQGWSLGVVHAQAVFRFVQFDLLLLVDPDHLGVWLPSSFVVLLNLNDVLFILFLVRCRQLYLV